MAPSWWLKCARSALNQVVASEKGKVPNLADDGKKRGWLCWCDGATPEETRRGGAEKGRRKGEGGLSGGVWQVL